MHVATENRGVPGSIRPCEANRLAQVGGDLESCTR